MNAAARRNAARRGWPRGLYEPRPGYYVWRHPTTGETLPIGRVTLAQAKAEALQANMHVEGMRPTLLVRMVGGDQTVADLLDKMPAARAVNTAKTLKSMDKIIRDELGARRCADLTTAACAELIEGREADGKARSAQALRSRLIAVCKRGMQLGWMESNPAEVTRAPSVAVKRSRLTLELFQQIRAHADGAADWLGRAMDLALVTGADRSTICTLTRKHVVGDALEVRRSKTAHSTGLIVHIPLALELRVAGLRLADLVRNTSGVASQFLVHHGRPWGNAPVGSPVHPDTVSRQFTEARKLAGIPDLMPDGREPPTFHEIRSLAKRLYGEQGDVDTKLLLGHSDDKTAAIYADPRGVAPVRVQIKSPPPNEREVNSK